MIEMQPEAVTAQAQHCKRLAHVIGVTQQMLHCAESGDWEQVARMELERRNDLLACFNNTPIAPDADLDAEAVATLLLLNEELMAKLKTARKALLNQNSEFLKSKTAATAYKAVEASG